jgi:hypothetical protein
LLKATERAKRVAQATGYEGISLLLYKVSLTPNRDMIRQGQRLSGLKFEERDESVILREQFFYKFEEELDKKKGTKRCCSAETKSKLRIRNSTRLWHLTMSTLPLLLFTTVGDYLIEDLGWEVFAIIHYIALSNFVIILLQMLFGYSNVVCNSEYIYDLAIDRMTKFNERYEGFLGPDAHIKH